MLHRLFPILLKPTACERIYVNAKLGGILRMELVRVVHFNGPFITSEKIMPPVPKISNPNSVNLTLSGSEDTMDMEATKLSRRTDSGSSIESDFPLSPRTKKLEKTSNRKVEESGRGIDKQVAKSVGTQFLSALLHQNAEKNTYSRERIIKETTAELHSSAHPWKTSQYIFNPLGISCNPPPEAPEEINKIPPPESFVKLLTDIENGNTSVADARLDYKLSDEEEKQVKYAGDLHSAKLAVEDFMPVQEAVEAFSIHPEDVIKLFPKNVLEFLPESFKTTAEKQSPKKITRSSSDSKLSF